MEYLNIEAIVQASINDGYLTLSGEFLNPKCVQISISEMEAGSYWLATGKLRNVNPRNHGVEEIAR